MPLKEKIFEKTQTKRKIFFLLGDIVLIALSCWGAFLLRFDGTIPEKYIPTLAGLIVLAAPLVIIFFRLENLYSISWTYVSINELIKLIRGSILAFLAVGSALFILKNNYPFVGFPRSIIFISGFLVVLTTGGFRFSKRIYLQATKQSLPGQGRRILIVGAGEAGDQIIRHITTSKTSPYHPVGLIDDNPMKQGVSIHGVKVLGTTEDIPDIVRQKEIEEIIITMPSASQKKIRKTVQIARHAGIETIKILPGTKEILAEKVSLAHLRDISIEDLLAREKVDIDTKTIRNFLNKKTVLVTGAAGSIGSHLCQQILNFKPQTLIGIDQNETGIFNLKRKLAKQFPDFTKSFIIGDICDKQKINQLFNQFNPDVVFHAAAYKHVPLMEEEPYEAVKNNIFGTLNLGEAALQHKTEKFVFVSTDKAVKPSSVMGATKQAGEMICLWLNKKNSTRFCAVRFGNVLDSQGNVVSIFENQIKKGGPVEVTHPEMKRYFMVTSEACLLVMQAGAISKGSEIFVLDMGKPIKIIDLAKEMIKLAGYEPDVDIPIVFTSPRPGEKFFEEILTDAETPTKHKKIFTATITDFKPQRLTKNLEKLRKISSSTNKEKIINILKKIVPSYHPSKQGKTRN